MKWRSLTINPAHEVGEWALLEAHGPGCAAEPIGVLLRNIAHDQLHVKLRPVWWRTLDDNGGAELWGELSEDLEQQAREIGAAQVLDWLENTASHAIRISARQEIRLTTAQDTLDRLYQQQLGADPRCSEVTRQNWGARALSRQRPGGLHAHCWKVQALLAAALLLGAVWTGGRSHRAVPLRPLVQTRIQEPGELPFFTGAHYQPVLLNLDSDRPLPRPARRPKRKMHVAAPRTRKCFYVDPVTVHPRFVRLARLDPPLLPTEPKVSSEAWKPLPLRTLPVLPPYRTRRNKFIRALALVSVPFRRVAR